MLKRDFFCEALTAGCALERRWVNSVFSRIAEDPETWKDDPYPFRVVYHSEGVSCVVKDPVDGLFRLEEIADSVTDPVTPLARWLERIDITQEDIENVPGNTPLITTYGNVLVNWLLLVHLFGGKFPFVTGEVNIGKLADTLFSVTVDTPEDWTPSTPTATDGTINVAEFERFGEIAQSLTAFNDIAVVSVTPKSLMGHPDAVKRRNALKEKYKDQLTDPVILAAIGKELEDLDREYMKGDPADKFYQVDPSKYYGKVRKRLFYMFGGEAPFSDGTVMTFIERSLDEGIAPKDLPIIINSLRHGTHSRGSQTQLGGEATKTIYRMVGNSRIADDDCGTTMGIPFTVTNDNHYNFVGFYELRKGQSVLLTADDVAARQGETIVIRSPVTCATKNRNLCSRCVGEAIAELPDGLAATSAQTSGVFLTSFLKAFHGKELRTVEMDLDHWLR